MAKQSDEFDDRNDDRNDDRDDRPRRRDDGPPPKKKSALPVVLGIFGVLLLVCCGVGGYFGYKAYDFGIKLVKMPSDFLAKISASDFQGAYDMTSPGFKSRVSLEEFTKGLKEAKLDKNTGLIGTPDNGGGGNKPSLNGNVGLPDGKQVAISFMLTNEPSDPFKFVIDDVTSPALTFGKPKPTDDKAKTKDDKPKPKEEEEDK
jgi:hypothetical protein